MGRLLASSVAVVAASALLVATLWQTMVASATGNLAGLSALSVLAAALAAVCTLSFRRAMRMQLPALLLSLGCLVALAFCSSTGAHTGMAASGQAAGVLSFAFLVSVVLVCTQIAGRLAQRHACHCE